MMCSLLRLALLKGVNARDLGPRSVKGKELFVTRSKHSILT